MHNVCRMYCIWTIHTFSIYFSIWVINRMDIRTSALSYEEIVTRSNRRVSGTPDRIIIPAFLQRQRLRAGREKALWPASESYWPGISHFICGRSMLHNSFTGSSQSLLLLLLDDEIILAWLAAPLVWPSLIFTLVLLQIPATDHLTLSSATDEALPVLQV